MKTIVIAVVAIVVAIAFPFLTVPVILGLVVGTLLFVLPSFLAFILLFPVLLLLGNAAILVAISVMLVMYTSKFAQAKIEAFFAIRDEKSSASSGEKSNEIVT